MPTPALLTQLRDWMRVMAMVAASSQLTFTKGGKD
tara:strand:+ start:393 stop:497 length:105 start_codon:yes stop_codon:yes gene_type:complete